MKVIGLGQGVVASRTLGVVSSMAAVNSVVPTKLGSSQDRLIEALIKPEMGVPEEVAGLEHFFVGRA